MSKSHTTSESTPKIGFAHMLRGLACISVVLAHWLYFRVDPSWAVHDTFLVNNVTPDVRPVQTGAGLLCLQLGQYGVLLFFLISGFVIPISLEHTKTTRFLMQRFFRIYFPYWVSLAIVICAIVFARKYFVGLSPANPWDFKDILSNVFLVNDFTQQLPIESVTWTLLVELKFYVLAFLIYQVPASRRLEAIAVGLTILFCISAIAYKQFDDLEQNNSRMFYLAVAVTNATPYLTYMLLGVIASEYWFGRMSLESSLVVSFFVFAAWIWSDAVRHMGFEQHIFHAWPSAFAVMSFWFFMSLAEDARSWLWQSSNVTLPTTAAANYVASISYPLYLIHGAFGFVVFIAAEYYIKLSMASVGIALAAVVLVSHFIHKYVELPSIRLGKWI